MDGRRRKTVHAARRPEERPKDASHSSTFTECTSAMLTLPSFAGPTSARSVTRTVRMRFSVGTAVEMIRQLKITRDTAKKARTTAMNTLKQIIVQAPPVLREALHDLTDHGLLTRCAGLRPGPIDAPIASAKHTLRSLARRWMALAEEIALHDQHLARLTSATSPTLCEGFGVGAHTAAELLIIFGDNPDRIRSEAAFAKLCGACPIPASSGMTTGRHRLNRGGHRHANAALYRAVIVRMQFHQPTRDYVARRIAAGRTKRDIIRCLKRFLARDLPARHDRLPRSSRDHPGRLKECLDI